MSLPELWEEGEERGAAVSPPYPKMVIRISAVTNAKMNAKMKYGELMIADVRRP